MAIIPPVSEQALQMEDKESMEKQILTVQSRSVVGRQVSHLRNEGLLPAVLYGGEAATVPLQLDRKDVDQLIERGGALQLINLVGEGLPETQVLMRDIQRHPVRRTLLHVDFVRVAKGHKLQTEVPLVTVGTAPVEEMGAIVLQNADTIVVECLPEDLPSQISVDLAVLEHAHESILASDLKLPEGVSLLPGTGDTVLFSVSIPRGVIEGEEEEEEMEDVGGSVEPEVIRRARDEDEE